MGPLNRINFKPQTSWISSGYGVGTMGHNSQALYSLEFSFYSRIDWYLKNSSYWELVNNSLWNKCGPSPTVVYKVLLEHGYVHLFVHCVWLLSDYKGSADLSSCTQTSSRQSLKHWLSGPLQRKLIPVPYHGPLREGWWQATPLRGLINVLWM